MGEWLGVGIANLAAALDPGTFVIGGGVSDAGDLLIRPATEAFRRTLTGRGFRPEPRIVRAHLGNQAGMIGAADLARTTTRRGKRRSRSRSRRPQTGATFGRGLGLSRNRVEDRIPSSTRARRRRPGSLGRSMPSRDDGPLDLAAARSRVYGVKPAEFVSVRGDLAKQARSAGDKDLAGQIQSLRKPTLAAWLVNALARERSDALAELLDLGREMREEMGAVDADGLRELTRRRHQLVSALVDQARELGAASGLRVADEAAALSAGDARGDPRRWRQLG